ncbi:Thoeris anti-defense Tad2 family protein [Paenibacillus sp. CMM36]
MNFGKAIEAIKQGKRIKRSNWKGYWALQEVKGSFNGMLPEWNGEFIVANVGHGFAPATAYQEDMLAEDWEIIE